MHYSQSLPNVDETRCFGRRLAKCLQPGDCVTLQGELGAGKTTLAQAVIHALAGDAVEVTSPTFALMQSYATANGLLWHCDFYRLKHANEAEALGLQDLFDQTISLVEWPEKADAWLPADRLQVTLRYEEDRDARTVLLEGTGAWQERIKEMV